MNKTSTPPALPGTLYLRLSGNGLCFARYGQGREPIFAFSSYRVRPQVSLTVNLREAFRTESILTDPIDRVHVMVVAPVTPVPLADFQEEDCEQLYNYCFPEDKPRRIFYDILAPSNAVLLFSLEEGVCRTLEEALPDVHYLSAQTPVLRHFAEKGAGGAEQRRAFVHCHGQTSDVAIYEENHLVMANSYVTPEAVDVAYYTLNVARHLGLDPATTPFYVAGETAKRDGAVAELKKYAANVYPIHPTGEFNRHVVATTPDVPYDLMTLLIE